jgi:hypothetical protein
MDKLDNKKIRELVFNKYSGHCAYCGCIIDSKTFTIDHIEPKFRGYSNDELIKLKRERGFCKTENYNPCCLSCNCSKSTMTLEKWRSEISKKYDRLLRDNSTFKLLNRFGLCIRNDYKITFYFELFNHE